VQPETKNFGVELWNALRHELKNYQRRASKDKYFWHGSKYTVAYSFCAPQLSTREGDTQDLC